MSNIFNSFSQISTITDATVFPVVENGLTRRATGQDLRQFVGQGEPGQGVPVGGAEGQMLVKASANDYDTIWVNPNSGATGPQGPQGATGPAGQDGIIGIDGATGPAGADGATGPAGADGATGPAGADGATGPAGTSISIQGSTSTNTELPFPYLGAIGDGYITQDTGNLWIYSNGTWTDVGTIVGPVGATGAAGSVGATGASFNEPATTVTLGGIIVGHNLAVTVAGTLSSITSIVGDVAPANPVEGDQWWDSALGRSFTYYEGLWIETSPNLGAAGPQGATGPTGPSDFTSISSHVLPSQDLTYDLGSSDKQWRSLYVGTSTIFIGGVPLTINTASNTLVIGTSTNTTATVATNLATERFVVDSAQNSTYVPANPTDWVGSPTVATLVTALDELAARVTALQNFEIDGGNAYTLSTGELLIDGNNGV